MEKNSFLKLLREANKPLPLKLLPGIFRFCHQNFFVICAFTTQGISIISLRLLQSNSLNCLLFLYSTYFSLLNKEQNAKSILFLCTSLKHIISHFYKNIEQQMELSNYKSKQFNYKTTSASVVSPNKTVSMSYSRCLKSELLSVRCSNTLSV